MIFELKKGGEFTPKLWPRGNAGKPESEKVTLEYVFPTGEQLDGYTKVLTSATTRQARQVAGGEDPENVMTFETIQNNNRIFRDCVHRINGIVVREDDKEREITSARELLSLPDNIGYHMMVTEFGNFILNSSRMEAEEAKNF